jgi:hypothetical protein
MSHMTLRHKLLSVAALTLILLTSGAKAQFSQVQVAQAANPAPQPKLVLQNIGLSPINPTDGFYTANVGLYLDRGPNNPGVSFGISIPHVRSLDEVFDKLKPALDDLSSELKIAAENFHPPH